MNERDKEIREKAWALVSDEERERNELYETQERWERCDQRFADLIRADDREALIRYFDGHWRDEWSEGQIIEVLEARGNT